LDAIEVLLEVCGTNRDYNCSSADRKFRSFGRRKHPRSQAPIDANELHNAVAHDKHNVGVRLLLHQPSDEPRVAAPELVEV
jgi:hypothetical protein